MDEERNEVKKMTKEDWIWIGLLIVTFVIGYFLG